MKLSRQDQIWNRASLGTSDLSTAVGDQALASLLRAHNLVMNGGVLHALECLSQAEIDAAKDGFNYFGLLEAADLLDKSVEDSEETEKRLNQQYRAAVPSDQTIVQAFRVKLLATPEVFSLESADDDA
jgi:hypothetical protein